MPQKGAIFCLTFILGISNKKKISKLIMSQQELINNSFLVWFCLEIVTYKLK